jgi:hypothetical protein
MSKGPHGVLALIGNTLLVEIGKLHTHPRFRICTKLESRNRGGSVKDRVALAAVFGLAKQMNRPLDEGVSGKIRRAGRSTLGRSGSAAGGSREDGDRGGGHFLRDALERLA